MIDNQRIRFSEVWDRVEHPANAKYVRVKVQNDIRTSKHTYKQTNIPDFQLHYP